ncbi:MAG: hypothetical protein RB296_09220 [Acidobacteriota bacterium]|jgi:hypothetical protein|nr:hypothetical protein [Acidobacteriota bacterium]
MINGSTRLQIAMVSGFMVLMSLGGLQAQDEVIERVDVLNREIVVRVFNGGDPVSGLTRKDIAVYEDGQPVQVTSFREIRRALSPEMTSASGKAEIPRGRLFLFLLWWNEESREWPQTWAYFVEKIFRPGDRVVLSNDRQTILIHSPQAEKDRLATFFASLGNDLKQKKLQKDHLAANLEQSVRNFHQALLENAEKKAAFKIPEHVLRNEFENHYRGFLDEYRFSRLRGQPSMLQKLAAALGAVNTEKWALLFMQNERLPLIHSRSRLFLDAPMGQETASALKRFVDECDKKIRLATDMAVQARDLRSLFIGAGATFHLFLSDAAGETTDSEQLRWMPAFSSWESAFRRIATDTGGRVQDTTRLTTALAQAAAHPDIYYVLTYRPGVPTLQPKVTIRLAQPELEAVYARRLEAREIQPLRISEPTMSEGRLRFEVADYLRETDESGTLHGDIHITVRAEAGNGEPLQFEKILYPPAEQSIVEMKMNFPDPGEYLVTVTARDRMSGTSARSYNRIQAPSTHAEPQAEARNEPADPQLNIVLAKAADYCRRLQRAAFRFTCTEWVDEVTLGKNPLSQRVEKIERHWRYDYQVVGGGSIQEQRTLIMEGHKRVNTPNAALSTRFSALYSVFMPVTLLGERNRGNYRYHLTESQRLKGRNCAIVDVTPRNPGRGPLAQGRVWVDVDNGSVLKIEMNPRGVQGSQALEAAAEKMSAKLDLNVVHWYLEKRNGLRFPSRTEFSESYVFDKRVGTHRTLIPYASETHGGRATSVVTPYLETRHRRVEFYRLTQEYKNYRYFEVDSSVEEIGPDNR